MFHLCSLIFLFVLVLYKVKMCGKVILFHFCDSDFSSRSVQHLRCEAGVKIPRHFTFVW